MVKIKIREGDLMSYDDFIDFAINQICEINESMSPDDIELKFYDEINGNIMASFITDLDEIIWSVYYDIKDDQTEIAQYKLDKGVTVI